MEVNKMKYIYTIVALLLAVSGGTALAGTPGGIIKSDVWGTCWTCTPMIKIMHDTTIPTEIAKAVRIYAAANEYEPFQIVLTPKKGLSGVKVIPHTLTGPQGAKIPAWNVSIRNVEYVNVTEATSKDVKPGWYPDPIPGHTPFEAPAGQNSPLWVTVYVAPKTPAGEYKGTIDITAGGISKIVVPINLRVWGFELPSVSRLRTAYGLSSGWVNKYQGASTLEQKRRLTDLYNLDFFKHRISPYTPYANYDIKITTENGNVKLDFNDFDIAIRKYFPLVNSFMLPRFGMFDDVGFGKGADADRMKIEYMRQVAEHLVAKGQLAKGYDYIMDEPEESQYDSIVQAATNVRMADERIKILLTNQVEPKLVGSVDIWTPIMPKYDEERSKARQAAGEEVWWYICTWPKHPYPNNFVDYTPIHHRIMPWISWRYGVTGILYWETCYWQDNPWESPMSYPDHRKWQWGNGDGHLLYPPVRKPSATFVDKGPVSSIRWEIIREGIEDYDYFCILKDEISGASASVKLKPSYKNALQALKLINANAKSRTEYCRDPGQLGSVRVKIAEAIEGLR